MVGSEAGSEPAKLVLTRTAALELRIIHSRSQREWGVPVADRYLADIYEAMHQAAANPQLGCLRRHRAAPFLMVPAGKHFVIYDEVPQGIVVLTVQHQVRDIETLIAEFAPAFFAEIERARSS